jgi:hypothetical protein
MKKVVKLTRAQLRSLLLKEAKIVLDPQGMQSMRAQRSFLKDNFEDETHFTREYFILKIIEAELDAGFEGIIDYVLGVDV